MNNYRLSKADDIKESEKSVIGTAWRRLLPLMKTEKKYVGIAVSAILITSLASLVSPVIIARAVDLHIRVGDFRGVISLAIVLLVVYIIWLVSNYIQIRTMGGVGRRVLFNLRNLIFTKLEELPVAFFNQNKAGDLISRINNDTDKLNQFFAQALMQFVGNVAMIVGSGVFLIVLNIKLGIVAVVPAVVVIMLTQVLSPWVKRTSLRSLRSTGGLSGEIQESLNNFKVIVAFNRLDYFRRKFKESNEENYQSSISAGVASNIFMPIYTLASTIAQLVVLAYGIHLIYAGGLSVGLLIGFLLYVNSFYMPLRQLASVWSSLQLALAGLDRIGEVLALESDMEVVPSVEIRDKSVLEFRDVSFGYPGGELVLRGINFKLEKGKTYALVGPTGGGKTTTASVMARLYDPTKGTVFLDGRDIRSYVPKDRTDKVGFILQEPFLFNGTVRENILYGNNKYKSMSYAQIDGILDDKGLSSLLSRFPGGLDGIVSSNGDTMSLGQKQIIAFMRAVLREPDILILDEATANIDTVTEQLLEEVLQKLPRSTTRVIIAHRLNTIENADEIFFVNGGDIKMAGNMEHAVEMLLRDKRQS